MRSETRTDRPTVAAGRAASRLGRAVSRALDDSELNPAGYRMLASLSAGASAAARLADKLAVSRPSVTATVDWLEARGFVERTPDRSDRRRSAIHMTPRGEAALATADRLVAERLEEVFGYLEPERAALVIDALSMLHEALDRDRDARRRR